MLGVVLLGMVRAGKSVVCRLGVNERFYQNLHNFTSLKLTDDKRDISSPFASTLGATAETPGELQSLIFYVLGSQSIRTKWFNSELILMEYSGSTMRSTQFHRETTAAGVTRAPVTLVRLRQVWDRINRHGHDGYQVYLGGPRSVLGTLLHNVPQDESVESQRVTRQAEPMPDARPPDGVTAAFVPNSSVTTPGPLTEYSTAFDPADVSRSAEPRTQPSQDDDGEPLTFKWNSDAGKRMRRWFCAFEDQLTDARLAQSYMQCFGEKQLGEVAAGTFSKETMARLVAKVQLMKTNEDLPPRKSNGKRELIPKDEKDFRATVDNFGEVFAACYAAGKILETIMFDPKDGIFASTCIKHRTREKVAGEMQSELTKADCFAWEIKQTKKKFR